MKKIILVAMAIFVMAFFNEEKVNAEEILTTYEEYIVEDENYLLWREANKPKPGIVVETNDYSDLFEVSEEVDDITINYLWQHMDKISETVVKHLRENGWKIYVQPIVYLNGTQVYGYTACRNKEIYIDTRNETTLIHEIGHVIHIDIISKKDISKWKDIIPSDINNVYFHEESGKTLEYILHKKTERFAQSFYEYVYYPWELEGAAPGIFQMYQNVCKLY